MLFANGTDNITLIPGIKGTPGTVSLESAASPGSFLVQTGYEAWVVLQTKAAALSYCNLTCAEFVIHTDSPFLAPGFVSFEATGNEKGKFMTVRDDQGSPEQGFPIRIQGIDDPSPSKAQAAFKLTATGGPVQPPAPSPSPPPAPPPPAPPAPAPTPAPTPTPAPAPAPTVTCDPKASPPENCPGGKQCPDCGKPSCPCPK